MGTSDHGGAYPASTMAMAIPIDLFVSKKHCSDLGLPRGELGFCDSSGNLVFRVAATKSESAHRKRRILHLLDAAGEPLLSMERDLKSKRSWKVFKEMDCVEKELVCTAEGRRSSLTRIEFDVFLEDEGEINCSSSSNGPIPSYKMKGFPFQKSCTIYKSDSIIAQTSLMYKLHQLYAKKSKYRITLYPTCNDASLIVALVGIFLQ